ncbi:hypothetical protein ACPCG0_10405 [Propionibacteriaceae bacterium Y1923]|uniref:hypothetical protein n=1 Tax=Aestuariimicrobium sp. Y1814 TaxID=3418742 RepID=UPI003C15DA84
MTNPTVDLGPARVDLGPYSATSRGRTILAMMWICAGLSVVLIGFSLYLVWLTWQIGRHGSVLAATGLVLVLSIFVLVLSVVGARQMGGATLALHDHGLSLRQAWFVNRQIPWSSITHLVPPGMGWTSRNRFEIVQADGRRTAVTRLALPSERAPDGTVVHHPDVQAVLDHYAQWQHRRPR